MPREELREIPPLRTPARPQDANGQEKAGVLRSE
jgi:hypothetical protein